jgi:hypothetical protein
MLWLLSEAGLCVHDGRGASHRSGAALRPAIVPSSLPHGGGARSSRVEPMTARGRARLLSALAAAVAPAWADAAGHRVAGHRVAGPGAAGPGATGSGTARSSRGFRIAHGIYLSDSVAVSLQPDGAYRVEELGGSRIARGRYAAGADLLTFVAGQGDVGRTRFPLKCRVAGMYGGFRVGAGQPACRAFEGLSFRRAN